MVLKPTWTDEALGLSVNFTALYMFFSKCDQILENHSKSHICICATWTGVSIIDIYNNTYMEFIRIIAY